MRLAEAERLRLASGDAGPVYWVKTNIDNRPVNLYRETGTRVDVWHEGEWRPTQLSRPELDGLGGSADFRQLSPKAAADIVPAWIANRP